MRHPERGGYAMAALLSFASPGHAARPTFDLPPARLRDAVNLLAAQAKVSVGLGDADLAEGRVGPLAGRMSALAALRRLVAPLQACVTRIDDAAFRIDRCRRRVAPAELRPPPADEAPRPEIVVTASKRGIRFDDFPGTAQVLDGDVLAPQAGLRGTASVGYRLPMLASTNLGSGRDKLFIRGVADSSFNGPTQATVGQYLGDVRLNYNAPDPDLTLYDIARVEVLEGPQGTLYGAGSLGGIFRIVPRPVDFDALHASVDAGVSATAHGAGGSDVAGMVNVPLSTGTLGLRVVGYRSVDGGYIDDVARGLSNVNHTTTAGGRAALAGKVDGWTIVAGVTLQDIFSRDGQYAERPLPRLRRASAVAQPFDNDYGLGSLTVDKAWGSLKLLSVTSAVRHHVTATYDFTPPGSDPTLFVQRNEISLYANENRLSRQAPDGTGWLIGTSILLDEERLTRTLGLVAAPVRIAGVRNLTADGAVFGEATIRLAPGLAGTVGARISFTKLDGEGLDQPIEDRADEPSRRQVRILPSMALSWKPGWQDATLFVRLHQGYRPGGLAVSGDPPAQSVERFQADVITTGEIGIHAGRNAPGRVVVSATISYAGWDDIQADLIESSGLPYTTNVGRGRILGAEGELAWRAAAGLSLSAAAFVNESELTHPAAGFAGSEASQLPNIPAIGGRVAVDYVRALSDRVKLTANLSGRYVGRSRLGVGPTLNIPQGNYLETNAALRIGTERFGFSLSGSNLTDTAANTFALGDPATVAQRLQTTPLRPRTIRAGVDARF